MSQEAVLAVLTAEWQTTTQVADAIPKAGRTDRVVHVRVVFSYLDKLVRWGLVEKRMTPDSWPGQRQAMWRLKT